MGQIFIKMIYLQTMQGKEKSDMKEQELYPKAKGGIRANSQITRNLVHLHCNSKANYKKWRGRRQKDFI